jgi:hypothetical protein
MLLSPVCCRFQRFAAAFNGLLPLSAVCFRFQRFAAAFSGLMLLSAICCPFQRFAAHFREGTQMNLKGFAPVFLIAIEIKDPWQEVTAFLWDIGTCSLADNY